MNSLEWKNTVHLRDLVDNEELTFEQQRDGIVARLDALSLDGVGEVEIEEFRNLVADLRATPDEEEFNFALDELYDWADADKRLWLGMVTAE